MKSDYGRWFVSNDGVETTVKCNRDRLIDCLVDILGAERAAQVYPSFRKATFAEHCRLELNEI